MIRGAGGVTRRIGSTPRVAVLAVIAALVSIVAACGLQSGSAVPLAVGSGSITPQDDLKGAKITVGSKDFTEQIILGYILEFALSAAGADVRDLTNISGSQSVRAAMESGQVDITYEYTGTAWITYLKHEKPITDPAEQFAAVAAEDREHHGLTWVNPAPLNNTYALATNQATLTRTGIRTLSQYADLVRRDPGAAATCLETEFRSRRDGFPGMAQAYGFDAGSVPIKILQSGIIYQAIANGNCNFGEVFTTDGRIKALNLALLEDDKKFFPNYNAAVVMRTSIAKKYPSIAKITKPVSDALTIQAITELNRQVDVDGREPADVARDWMVSKGFVTKGDD